MSYGDMNLLDIEVLSQGTGFGGAMGGSQEIDSGGDVGGSREVTALWTAIQKQQQALSVQQDQLTNQSKILTNILEELRKLKQPQGDDESPDPSKNKNDYSHGFSAEEVQRLIADRREAPAPEPFSFSAGRSFNTFICQFEAYCMAKFTEGTYERWTGELAKFLIDDALQMYRVFGGGDCAYSRMKSKLRLHMEGDADRERTRKFTRFHAAIPQDGESLYLYALRLERLYLAAYPTGDPEDSFELRSRFLATVPAEEAVTVTREEENLKTVLNVSRVPWSRLVALLRQRHEVVAAAVPSVKNDRQTSSSLVWSYNEEPQRYRPDWRNRAGSGSSFSPSYGSFPRSQRSSFSPSHRSNEIQNQRRRSISRDRVGQSAVCNFCGIPGHLFKNCWRRLGYCLRCGSSEHLLVDCRRPHPGRREPPRMESGSQNDRSRNVRVFGGPSYEESKAQGRRNLLNFSAPMQ